jgi:hypothetical protein
MNISLLTFRKRTQFSITLQAMGASEAAKSQMMTNNPMFESAVSHMPHASVHNSCHKRGCLLRICLLPFD